MMDENRIPAATVEEVMAFDIEEVLEGYHDGLAGDEEPGNNRSKAYWHGWRNGNGDRHGTADAAQRALVRDYADKGAPLHPGIEKAPPREG